MDITIHIRDEGSAPARGPLPGAQQLLGEIAAKTKTQAGSDQELRLLREIAQAAYRVTQTRKENPVEREDKINRLVQATLAYEEAIGDALWRSA